ncbi:MULTISPECIES: radical SAM/SPASM domain-containing protein [Paenibacillus]|uniref:radical SAM/SPASM domain-containing protein n=1 Tax=Paenibacillus TaxID=44249 RepID=UPI001FFFC6BE|nr:radical SAM protein [Paenibacillus pabuli]UPK44009.1 radical SAM protein [Paenibacillus pabuli]
MIVIENLVSVRLNPQEILLVNTLNGLLDVVDNKSMNTIERWKEEGIVNCLNHDEDTLFKQMSKRGYIVKNKTIESSIRETLMDQLLDQNKNEKEKLKEIALVLSYNCNFSCPYCYEALEESGSKKIITEDMVDKAISLSGGHLEHITLFGGEPLLISNRKIINYITSNYNKYSYSVITNGYYLDEYIDIFKKIDVKQVQVTIDGTEATHDLSRCLKNGKGTYTKIMKGVTSYLENGIPIKIRMNMSEENYVDCINHRDILLEQYKEFTDILSFEMATIFDTSGEKRSKINQELMQNDLKNTVFKKKESINQYLSSSLPITKFFTLNKPIKPIITPCRAHTNSRFYDSEGNIYSCILSVGKERFSIGKYYPKVETKQNSIINRNVSNIEQCSQCKYALICGGGCPLIFNDDNLMLPNCSYCMDELYEQIPNIYNTKHQKVINNI